MERKNIPIESFNTDIFAILNKGWMLLTAGDFATRDANTMTVSWGFMGTIWTKPVVIALVRPQRHTLKLMDKYDSFTMSAFPESNKDIMSFCGSHSGSDTDKIKECKLTMIPSQTVSTPGFEEAELIIECRQIYRDQIKSDGMIDKTIMEKFYPANDLHHIFFGEVTAISGVGKYVR